MNGYTRHVGGRQQGLTLIEIMVALALSAILLSGVAALFVEMRHSSRVERSLGEIQSGGRYSILHLARELRMAGYYGCNVESVVNTLNNAANYAWDFQTPIQGHEYDTGGTWSPGIPTSLSTLSPPPDNDSDIVTVRSLSSGTAKVTAHPGGTPPGSAALIVPDSGDLEVDDIVIAMSCPDAAVFQITNVNTSNSSVVHNTGGGSSPGNATKNLQANFTGGEVAKISTKTFFVRTDADGVPGLWVLEADDAPVELVSGVEALQVQYGEDTDGDGMVDTYRDANAVADWEDVMSVSLSALVRASQQNITTSGGQQSITFEGVNYGSDGRLRKTFRNTVALRNRLP